MAKSFKVTWGSLKVLFATESTALQFQVNFALYLRHASDISFVRSFLPLVELEFKGSKFQVCLAARCSGSGWHWTNTFHLCQKPLGTIAKDVLTSCSWIRSFAIRSLIGRVFTKHAKAGSKMVEAAMRRNSHDRRHFHRFSPLWSEDFQMAAYASASLFPQNDKDHGANGTIGDKTKSGVVPRASKALVDLFCPHVADRKAWQNRGSWLSCRTHVTMCSDAWRCGKHMEGRRPDHGTTLWDHVQCNANSLAEMDCILSYFWFMQICSFLPYEVKFIQTLSCLALLADYFPLNEIANEAIHLGSPHRHWPDDDQMTLWGGRFLNAGNQMEIRWLSPDWLRLPSQVCTFPCPTICGWGWHLTFALLREHNTWSL